MATSSMFPDLAELLRRAEIAKGLQAMKGPTPGPATTAYQEALKQKAPQVSDYHPSLKRRIAGGIIGGLTGLGGNPKLGVEVGTGVVNAPFNKQVADYQGNLERLKEGASVEEASQLKGAQTQEQVARTEAEKARAVAEGARTELYKYQVEHPESRYKPLASQEYEVELQDGTKLIAHTDQNGSLADNDGNRIPGSTIKNSTLRKPGAEKPDVKKLVPQTGEVVNLTKGTTEEVATPIPRTTSSPEERNKEWDRRNKIQFNQRLQAQRAELANGLVRLQKASDIRTSEPTTQTRATAEFARTVERETPSLLEQVDNLKDKLGPGEGRWNQMWVNKGGFNDPEFAGLDQELQMYATSLVRVHFGLRGGQNLINQLHKDFSEAQSPEDLKARIQHSDKWVKAYADMHPSESGKGTQPAQGTQPATGTPQINPKDPMGILGGK